MNVLEWLQTAGQTTEETPCTVIEELGRLIGMNGGMAWKGHGVFQVGGPYGRIGLHMAEALRLVYLSGMLDGFTRAEEAANTAAVTEAIRAEIKRAADALPSPLVGPDGKVLDR